LAGGAAAGIAATLGGGRAAYAAGGPPPTDMTPDAALQELVDGNRRFISGKPLWMHDDLAHLKERAAQGQAPFAGVLACADSRVPVELLFDQSIGHLFVTRVAGNVASTEVIASLEYGAAVLGTKAIIVIGHSACGAVQATIDGKAVPGQISALYRDIRPAVAAAGKDVNAATKENARLQAGILRDSSPVLGELIKKKQLKIVAGFYDVGTGVVTML
jgi:carbonic anhydrase